MDGRVSFSPLAAILKKLKQGMRRDSSRERDDLVGWGYHNNNSYHMYIVLFYGKIGKGFSLKLYNMMTGNCAEQEKSDYTSTFRKIS